MKTNLAVIISLSICVFPLASGADIFKWEYIDPANPSLGKQPSNMRAPDGAGVNAVPAVDLSNRNLTMAYLIGAYLTPYAEYDWEGSLVAYITVDLTGANLSQADFTNANLLNARLTAANLTGAEVRGASFNLDEFGGGTGITTTQLYCTGSYQAHDLTGIKLGLNNLANVNFVSQNLNNATFVGATLTNANFSQATLAHADLSYAQLNDANFSQANLANASFGQATLNGAILTNSDVRGAQFGASNLTPAQLYSTASYATHDLTGVAFDHANLAGWNFVSQNLTKASLYMTTLTNADFSQANLTNAFLYESTLTSANLSGAVIQGAYISDWGAGGITKSQLYSTASYMAHDLSGLQLDGNNLTGVNFTGQNLTNASLYFTTLTNANFSQANLTNASLLYASLTGANFTGANVRAANFLTDPSHSTGMTPAQLYSTASYASHDLSGIGLGGSNLTGVNLAGQNLANARFSGFVSSDGVSPSANLTNANLSGADARGANFYLATLTGANTTNLIQSNGHIAGLHLQSGASLVVRDYDGNPTASPPTGQLPIVVDQHLTMSGAGTLTLVFDADTWNSTISFAGGIPVALGGTLELSFAPDVSLASQYGRTIDLFDWTGVSPSGAFTVSSAYTWNLSKLYTTGEVTLTSAIAGDVNLDGLINIFDINTVSSYRGTSGPQGDANGDGIVNIFDINLISANWTPTSGGATPVPEPAAWVLSLSAIAFVLTARAASAARRGSA